MGDFVYDFHTTCEYMILSTRSLHSLVTDIIYHSWYKNYIQSHRWYNLYIACGSKHIFIWTNKTWIRKRTLNSYFLLQCEIMQMDAHKPAVFLDGPSGPSIRIEIAWPGCHFRLYSQHLTARKYSKISRSEKCKYMFSLSISRECLKNYIHIDLFHNINVNINIKIMFRFYAQQFGGIGFPPHTHAV